MLPRCPHWFKSERLDIQHGGGEDVCCVRVWRASGLTDEAEDVPDVGDADDQRVVEGQDGESEEHVADPAEVSAAAEQHVDGGADLSKHRGSC